METIKCKICGWACEGTYALSKHRKTEHPEQMRKYKTAVPNTNSVLSRIAEGERLIQDALRDIEIEQRKLQERILELDTLRAKYKKA